MLLFFRFSRYTISSYFVILHEFLKKTSDLGLSFEDVVCLISV